MVSITSSSKSEGKTITAVNIAIALAQQVDTRVLIIDCDLRRPRIQSVLEIPVDKGITNYLNFECEVSDIVYTSKLDNLDAICCGTIPPNPSELLSSDNMKELIKELSKQYDYIIFDTPPIGVVIDALPIIKQTDGVVVIVRDNVTDIRDYKKQLIFSNAPKLILSVLY
ncbi:capsular exopolysaccharide family protein, partial [human gut metagenome]